MIIKNTSNQKIIAGNAWECKTFLERCKGLMFQKINADDACVLVNPSEDFFDSIIHMAFVPQDLDVIWLNKEFEVVTIKKCRKANMLNWWVTHSPSQSAKYIIEVLDAKNTLVGDKIQFIK